MLAFNTRDFNLDFWKEVNTNSFHNIEVRLLIFAFIAYCGDKNLKQRLSLKF